METKLETKTEKATSDDFASGGGCGCIAIILLAVALFCAIMFIPPTYRRCDVCPMAYRQYWYQCGFPGQATEGWFNTCRGCGGRLRVCTKEQSGWDDSRPPDTTH